MTWAGLEWKFRGKPSVLGACSGLVAGLACITQAAGYVTLMPALLIGVVGAAVCYTACTRLKAHFGYDDSLDVFGVHGVAGTLGRSADRASSPPGPPAPCDGGQTARPARRRPAAEGPDRGGAGRLGPGHRRHVRDSQGARRG